MNTSRIKKYAPKARTAFIDAVTAKATLFGIHSDTTIDEAKVTGEVMQIGSKTFSSSLAPLRQRLVERVQRQGFEALMEQVAYSWFNRLCAIRYMEVHDYLGHGLKVLEDFEILQHAADAAADLEVDRNAVLDLKLNNKDEELYRLLLQAQCHQLHKAMPFLFEAIDDETELLLPDNLTRTDSLIRSLVNELPEEDWQQVEVIGWLYQFYISEKKDEVIGKVVKSEDIPAATQLFTPNWIVKYLVQNSVGRQWLQTYPDSAIKGEMEYYIEPAEQTDEVNKQLKDITPKSIDPKTIKVLDPACGSGHILVEAYNVLKAIYEEQGERPRDIPKLILENNLFGLDIDDRAAQLAGFALMMMARNDDRRIFTREIKLNILSLQETAHLNLPKLWNALNLTGKAGHGTSTGLFEETGSEIAVQDENYQLLADILQRFEQAKTFGSLIDVPGSLAEPLKALLDQLRELAERGDTVQKPAAKVLVPFVRQAWVLAQRYDAVVANPPYMGGKGMNADLKILSKTKYPNSKSDLFSIFIERCLELGVESADLGLVTPYVWMFLSSYEKLREDIVNKHTLTSLIQLEYNAFAPACIPVCTFTISKQHLSGFTGGYIRLSDFKGHLSQAPKTIEAIENRTCSWFFEARPEDFKEIPGCPISYWVSHDFRNLFSGKLLSECLDLNAGMSTGDNEKFQRLWFEVSIENIEYCASSNEEAKISNKKWFPCNSGGEFRKWFGNNSIIVNWENDGYEIRNFRNDQGKLRSAPRNTEKYFQSGVTWTKLSSGRFAARWMDSGFTFDDTGRSGFLKSNYSRESILAQMNSNLSHECLSMLTPSMSFTSGELEKIPVVVNFNDSLKDKVCDLVKYHREDWNGFERAWGCKLNSLVKLKVKSIPSAYELFKVNSSKNVHYCREIEILIFSEINKIAKIENEISNSIPIEQITLTVNPHYRYNSKNATDQELENRFQSDTLAELISYSIGCMMGRYSLDREGLVYAHAGNEGFNKLVEENAYQTFPADDDGIIPMLDEPWFGDDATNRFRDFVKTVWGEESVNENLDFVAQSLCLYGIKPKKTEGALETIRRYLSTQFYKDHLRTYKKRPIYWLFSSGKQKAFECLVYLHRYNEGTLARMRTEYVTPLLGKYDATLQQLDEQVERASSTAEANKLKKQQTALEKKLTELRAFDDNLKHYADRRISLDLDDGVKVNYGKFGGLLHDVKAVTGKKPA
ncbi:SAM-dependent methyltransferase [Endozoicomonas sp. OPT23]|uniref:BREX-1 system adenine-specific DNA-methyltransferase PglX n=1 Tax=Endozoicomonas sp. OPT23 TaxID=2072845 RepID=UPI00129A12C8|nr:BREX-1 system adenine-specific DNA-methyltransferase PglX [Endozoicomonas sp. OPT23]MRI34248.1 SAM-dependent methyltransferase [Endozoicomonas sp. OPT23]